MTPARARIRFSFLDMTVLPFRMILPAYKYKGKPQEKSCSPDTGADLRVCLLYTSLLINSTYGRAFKAIRDDEIAAEAMGINLAHHKRLAFVISSFFAGISGGLLAMYQTTIQASMRCV